MNLSNPLKERDILLKIKKIAREFSICKVTNISRIDFSDEFCFVGKTDEEISFGVHRGTYP